jgi:hypothetical protein
MTSTNQMAISSRAKRRKYVVAAASKRQVEKLGTGLPMIGKMNPSRSPMRFVIKMRL